MLSAGFSGSGVKATGDVRFFKPGNESGFSRGSARPSRQEAARSDGDIHYSSLRIPYK